MLPTRVLYYGKDEDLPERVELHAGPLELVYEQGDLRRVCCGGQEILRRVYVAVRDRNWGTVAPVFSDVEIRRGEDSFRIVYQVENRQAGAELHFVWRGEIIGKADGTITFTMDGEARSSFWRNRIGFCVLYPAGLAGHTARVVHVDGSQEDADFPVDIVPLQPVPPFSELHSITLLVAPGLRAEVSFAGDIFEMEDQRNWTDASYKIFSTPLRLPFPVEIQAGAKITQAITLRLLAEAAGGIQPVQVGGEAHKEIAVLRVAPGSGELPLPKLGLGMTTPARALTAAERERLRALHPDHLRVDLRLDEADYPQVLKLAIAEAEALGVGLHMALLAADAPDAELEGLRRVIDEQSPPVSAWLCYAAAEKFTGGSATAAVLKAARRHLEGYAASIPFYAGANTDFIFLSRTPPPPDRVDGLTFSICPQVHAFDNASLVETLPVQGDALRSARRRSAGKPVMVSPVTLKMRHNPYATGAASSLAPGELPPQVDVRQMSLFGAAWTLGSLAALSEAGAASLTYYQAAGWQGVMEAVEGSALPEVFRSLPGEVFPLYHVLAEVGEFAGGSILPVHTSRPLQATGLLLRKDGRERLLLANLLPTRQTLRVEGLAPAYLLRRLDEESAHPAMRAPQDFRTGGKQRITTLDGAVELELRPYATLILDAV